MKIPFCHQVFPVIPKNRNDFIATTTTTKIVREITLGNVHKRALKQCAGLKVSRSVKESGKEGIYQYFLPKF